MEITAILTLLSIVEQAAATLQKIRADAAQRAAWTPEQNADFDARMEAAFASSQWKTDAESGR